MKHFSHIYVLAIALILMTPVVASASAILRAGETVSITDDQVIDGDFYASGGIVSNSGEVLGDMHVLAGSFTNNGNIDGDLTVAGGTVQVHASVTDDVRVAGGEVVIAGPVGGDVVVFGGLLKILSTAEIEGDILFFGGDLQVLGAVEGSVMGTADSIRIDAHVGESVDVTVGRLSLGDRAEVLGDVRYVSNTEVNRSQNAVIVGDVVENSAPEPEAVSYDGLVISFIIMLFTALVLQLLFRSLFVRVLPELTTHMGMAGLIGVSAILVAPIIIMVAIASVLGAMVGVILLVTLILCTLMVFAIAGIVIGVVVQRYTKGTVEPNVFYTAIGVALFQMLFLIPLLGPTLVFVIYFIILGGVMRLVFNSIRNLGS